MSSITHGVQRHLQAASDHAKMDLATQATWALENPLICSVYAAVSGYVANRLLGKTDASCDLRSFQRPLTYVPLEAILEGVVVALQELLACNSEWHAEEYARALFNTLSVRVSV
eukprot:3935882-Rhodomonas_salina.1